LIASLQRKRGRPIGSKYAKSKMGRKPAFTHICSSNSEGERGKDDDFDPAVRILRGNSNLERIIYIHVHPFCEKHLIGAID
jgi:hypothetical protein